MISLIIFAIAGGIYILRKDFRRDMLLAGIFTLPLILLLPVFNRNFFAIFIHANIFYFLLQIGGVFSLGGVVVACYKLFIHRHFARYKHPKSHLFSYLAVGPLVLLILAFVPQIRFAYSISFCLILDLIILLAVRRDLLVDAIYAGFAMAITYSVSLLVQPYVLPGQLNNFWFGSLSGLNLLFTPIEEVIIIMLFGMLMGPLYVAATGIFGKKPA